MTLTRLTSPRLLTYEVSRIVELDENPVLRNLLITQCYHDLSLELARVLGAVDVNWCTFAVWASKTAGRFIRNEEIPARFARLLGNSPTCVRCTRRAAEGLRLFHPGGTFGEASLIRLAERVASDVSGQVMAGNLKVFSELGSVFSRFVRAFDNGSMDVAAINQLIASLREGSSAADGQSLLQEALLHFVRAAQEPDPVRKAQQMLVANALTGLHEQIRLQPHIAAALNAPIADLFGQIWGEHAVQGAAASVVGRIHALWDRLGAAVVHDAERVWGHFSALELMTLCVPGQTLHLGSVLPPVRNGSLYPAVLIAIDNEAALELLEQYDALDPLATGEVGATDWTLLAQRMRYILALFRSRQQEPTILSAPFSDFQHAAILAGSIPPGPLS